MSAENRPRINLDEPEDPGYELTPEIAEILDAAGQNPVNLIVRLKPNHTANFEGLSKKDLYPEMERAVMLNLAGILGDIDKSREQGEENITVVPLLTANSISLLARGELIRGLVTGRRDVELVHPNFEFTRISSK